MAKIIKETDFSDEVLNSSIPVLVDFFSDSCMPCKMMEPILEELSQELENEIKIVKVDVLESEELSDKYDIKNIPTLIFFKSGEVVETIVGAMQKNDLLEILRKLIG